MTDQNEIQPTAKLGKSVKPVLKRAQYVVVTGFNFGCTSENDQGTRVEPGPLMISLPPNVLDEVVAMGAVVEVKGE